MDRKDVFFMVPGIGSACRILVVGVDACCRRGLLEMDRFLLDILFLYFAHKQKNQNNNKTQNKTNTSHFYNRNVCDEGESRELMVGYKVATNAKTTA